MNAMNTYIEIYKKGDRKRERERDSQNQRTQKSSLRVSQIERENCNECNEYIYIYIEEVRNIEINRTMESSLCL